MISMLPPALKGTITVMLLPGKSAAAALDDAQPTKAGDRTIIKEIIVSRHFFMFYLLEILKG